MNELQPYSEDELRHLRRLIIAAGVSVEEWAGRLRRTADFLQSLSPAQAAIVAQQALAIGARPHDYGDEALMVVAREEIAAVPEADRLRHVSIAVIAVRRKYFEGLPEE